MDRNLALEFIRVTEAAAISCAKWYGKGDKNSADGAAVKAMRERFNHVDCKGKIVIGEGEKDEAPMLYEGEEVGNGNGLEVDIAVDPLECTSNLAKGKLNSISVLAAGPKGSLKTFPGTYMEHIIVGPKAAGKIDINKSVKENLMNIANALDKKVEELTVVVLERDRHTQLIKNIREAGARLRLIEHGTIVGGIAPAIPNTGLDVLMGTGGAPEAVIIAAALKCVGGEIQAKLSPHNEKTREDAIKMGYTDLQKVYFTDDLAKGNELMFIATGISDGPFLKGVNFASHNIITYSVVMRAKTKTIRFVETHHHVETVYGL
jgi:fructose-1,6-bisphosphatase II